MAGLRQSFIGPHGDQVHRQQTETRSLQAGAEISGTVMKSLMRPDLEAGIAEGIIRQCLGRKCQNA